jgi:hypothetical protein
MALTREQALAALGLTAAPDSDAAAVQAAFERLARRYPQPHFPERFRTLLEARDQLLAPERAWREQLESRTLNLSWILPRVRPDAAASAPDRRSSLQALLRAGLFAEPLMPDFDEWGDDDDDDDDDFEEDDEDEPF